MPSEPVDTREHDLAGCRQRHGTEGPAAGLPCYEGCGCRCHIDRHVFDPDADYDTWCRVCGRPKKDMVHIAWGSGACGWPAVVGAEAHCGGLAGPQVAVEPTMTGEVARVVAVCPRCAGRALGAGWFVHTPRAPHSGQWAPDWGRIVVPDAPRAVPDPMPPMFPPGQEPRGLVAPMIAYGLITAAVTLYVAGEVWDAAVRRRAHRRLIRALHRMVPYG